MLSNGETTSAPEGEDEAAWTTIDLQGYEYRPLVGKIQHIRPGIFLGVFDDVTAAQLLVCRKLTKLSSLCSLYVDNL
jgi:hypothetical protein